MEQSDELFPVEELPPVCRRALQSLKMPDLVALVQICDRLARVFRPAHEAPGSAAVVDAVRFFGGKFSNTVRWTIAAAAGLKPGVQIPADFSPQRESVRTAQRMIARRLLLHMDEAREALREIADGHE